MEKNQQKLQNTSALLESFSFKKTLERGFSLVTGDNGQLIRNAEQARQQQKLTIEFADTSKVTAMPDVSWPDVS